jgi:uncharacterized protein (DUF3084 family)
MCAQSALCERVEHYVTFKDDAEKILFERVVSQMGMRITLQTVLEKLENIEKSNEKLIGENREIKESIIDLVGQEKKKVSIFPDDSRYAKIKANNHTRRFSEDVRQLHKKVPNPYVQHLRSKSVSHLNF